MVPSVFSCGILPHDYGWSLNRVCINAQPANTCSKLTIETLEQGVKYVQS